MSSIGKYFAHSVEECIVGVKGRYDDLKVSYNLQTVKNGILEMRRVGS